MNKRLALVSIGLTVSTFLIGVAACSSDSEPNTFPESEPDAQFDQGLGFNQDGYVSADTLEPIKCDPHLPATFRPTWTAPTKSASCSDDDLAAYFQACLTNLADPDAGAGCKAWLAANDPCASCLEPANNTGPVQYYKQRKYNFINIAGCLSILRNEVEAGACPATIADSLQCQRESCFECQGTFDVFAACEATARTNGCKQYEATASKVCGPKYNNPDGGAYDCFPKSGESAKTVYTREMKIFCGK